MKHMSNATKYINKKYPKVSIINIFNTMTPQKWNKWLLSREREKDVESLKATRYGLAVDMDDLAKQKLNNSELTNLYLRLQKSIEDTAKRIYRKVYPNPCDNPKQAKNFGEYRKAKRNRDRAFELFLKETAF